MTDFATPDALARRTAAAVTAAVGAGRELGLAVDGATVLHDLFSVVVRLDPAPVVARVPVVLPDPADLASVAVRQRSELAVTSWLADRGVPVVPPSPLVPREPVQRGGFSMTFWQFVEQEQGFEPDYVANTEKIPALHAALRDYPEPLSFLATADPWFVTEALDRLGDRPDLLHPADLERVRREWTVLRPLVVSRAAFEQRFPGTGLQPIHGDCPPANLVAGVGGTLYADFELVTLGPVEWDLATLGPDLGKAYDRAAPRAGVRTLDREVLAFVDAVGLLRAITTLALAPQLPVLVGYLTPAVDRWRETPFAGGVAG